MGGGAEGEEGGEMKGMVGGKSEGGGGEAGGEMSGEVGSKTGGEARGGEGSSSGVGTLISKWLVVDASVETGAVTEDLD